MPDVLADFGHVVHVADDAEGFAAGCRAVLGDPVQQRDARFAAVQARHEWDDIAGRMALLMAELTEPRTAEAPQAEATA